MENKFQENLEFAKNMDQRDPLGVSYVFSGKTID